MYRIAVVGAILICKDVCPKFRDNQSTVLKHEIGNPRQNRETERVKSY